jgi:hypothetical protein
MVSDNQWRIDNAKRLQGLQLHLRRYRAWSKAWDHDHCTACWARFTECEGSDGQTEGYATGSDYPKGAGYEWVCRQCFTDLKTEMEWREIGG